MDPRGLGSGLGPQVTALVLARRPWILFRPIGLAFLGLAALDPVLARRLWILGWLLGHGPCLGPSATDPVLAFSPWILLLAGGPRIPLAMDPSLARRL